MKFLGLYLFLFSLFCGFGSNDVKAQKTISLSKKDKKTIVNQVFNQGFEQLMKDERFLLCTIPIVKEKHIILIETIEPKIFPKQKDNYQFMFMTPNQIENEIKSNDGDCYFALGNFQITNNKLSKFQTINNKVRVTLWRWIKVITVVNGKSWYPSRWVGASGLIYQAIKINGKWKVKFLNGTAIVS